jgi:two-component system response regulator AtoC
MIRNILFVDNDPEVHACVRLALEPDFSLVSCYTGSEALAVLNREKPDLVLSEIVLPDMNGLDLMRSEMFEIRRPAFIAASRSGDTHLVAQAIKAGADDYLLKPYDVEDIVQTVRKCLSLKTEAPYPVKDAEETCERLIGESFAMRSLRRQIRAYARTDKTILVTGESGTGKELVARRLHCLSPRSGGPFYALNCGALPETLFESEMFGSEKGAYTDAVSRSGFFESSDGGTLFLDEAGELSAPMQVKLLRVLEEKRILHLGSRKPIPVDIRIIAATNRNLHEDVVCGRFRGDLFYRLNVLRICIPPLRERREDIPILCYTFLRELQNELPSSGVLKKHFSAASIRKLSAHAWPGNVRELKNVVERAFYTCEDSKIEPEIIQLDDGQI